MRIDLPCSSLALIALTACSMSHSRRSDTDGGASDAGECTPLFEPCEAAGECCEGYCPLDTYGPIVCTARAPNGVFCLSDDECESRRCVDAVCGGSVPACVPAGAACSHFPGPGGECCAGTRCLLDASGNTTCLVPPSSTCLDEGEVCSFDGVGCCGGLTCVGEISYGPTAGYCRRVLADGEACVDETVSACASRLCIDGMCRAESCVADEALCETSSDCCAGFCDDSTYGPWVCRPRQPTGAFCMNDTWCVSRSCVANSCR